MLDTMRKNVIVSKKKRTARAKPDPEAWGGMRKQTDSKCRERKHSGTTIRESPRDTGRLNDKQTNQKTKWDRWKQGKKKTDVKKPNLRGRRSGQQESGKEKKKMKRGVAQNKKKHHTTTQKKKTRP